MQYFPVGYNAKYFLCCINVLERLIIPLTHRNPTYFNMYSLFFNKYIIFNASDLGLLNFDLPTVAPLIQITFSNL